MDKILQIYLISKGRFENGFSERINIVIIIVVIFELPKSVFLEKPVNSNYFLNFI